MIQITSSEKTNTPTESKDTSFSLTKKKWGKRKKIVMGVIVILFLIILISIGGGDKKPTSTKAPTIQYVTQAGTPARLIEEKVVQTLGEKTNMDEKRIREITVESDRIFIDFVADENLTTNLTRRGMWTDITGLLEKLPAQIDPKIEYLIFQAYHPLVDQYGKESIDRVMLVTVARKTWEKIEWDNFLKENLSKIADSYWEHPALSK